MLKSGIESAPWMPELPILLGWILHGRKDSENAKRAFAQAVRNAPNHPDALYGMGFVLMDAGEFALAAEHFQQALRINPNDQEPRLYLAAWPVGGSVRLPAPGNARGPEFLRQGTQDPDELRARTFLVAAKPGSPVLQRGAQLALGGTELSTVNAGLAGNCAGCAEQLSSRLFGKHSEFFDKILPLHCDALGDGRPLWKDAAEVRVVPSGGKMNEAVDIQIGVDQADNGRERQVCSINRVGDQKRISRLKVY